MPESNDIYAFNNTVDELFPGTTNETIRYLYKSIYVVDTTYWLKESCCGPNGYSYIDKDYTQNRTVNGMSENNTSVGARAIIEVPTMSNMLKKGKGQTVPTISSCPGCKFIYTTSSLAIETTEMQSLGLIDDYTKLTRSAIGHPHFLGVIESTTNQGKIGRLFACGIEGTTPFCLEGYDTSKWTDGTNIRILNTIFPGCGASTLNSPASCVGSSVGVLAKSDGSIAVDNKDNDMCYVSQYGQASCLNN